MHLQASRPGRTELLIVGTAHLTDAVPDSALQNGMRLLRTWRPDAIAIEHLPGHLVVEYQQRGGAYEDFHVGGASQAREGATTVAHLRDWNVWQAKAIARDRRQPLTDRVVGWLLAHEPCNALLLQWRQADLPSAATDFMNRFEQSPSERVRIGARLASDLGHDELVHFDDHAGVDTLDYLPPTWESTVEALVKTLNDRFPSPPRPADIDKDPLTRWTWTATPEVRDWLENIESVSMATISDPTGVLRARLAQWRTRNLAMAARLRDATALIPGGRLLAIVGSSHERPLRAALSTDQHDLSLTDIASLAGE